MLLKQLLNCISSQIGWHTWIVKHLGQTKKGKQALTIGLRIVMTKRVKTLRNQWGWPGWGGRFCCVPGAGVGIAINTPFARFRKSLFRKDSQVRNACSFASFCKYAFAEILRFGKLSQYYSGFRKLSRKFANMVSQCFAIFRNLWFRKLSQGFARIRKWTFARIRKCENPNHGCETGNLNVRNLASWMV